MNAQNIIMDLIPKTQETPVKSAPLKPQVSSSFKDTFEKVIFGEKKVSFKDNADKRNSETQHSTDAQSGTKVKSFREAKINKIRKQYEAEKDKALKDKEIEKVKAGPVKEDSLTEEEMKAVNSLAAALGIKPQELLEILKELGIKPEDLLDVAKLAEIVNRVSQALKLSKEEEKLLQDMMREVSGDAGKTQEPKTTEAAVKVTGDEKTEGTADEKTADTIIDETSAEFKNVRRSDGAKTQEGTVKNVKAETEDITVANNVTVEDTDSVLSSIREKAMLFIAALKLKEKPEAPAIDGQISEILLEEETKGKTETAPVKSTWKKQGEEKDSEKPAQTGDEATETIGAKALEIRNESGKETNAEDSKSEKADNEKLQVKAGNEGADIHNNADNINGNAALKNSVQQTNIVHDNKAEVQTFAERLKTAEKTPVSKEEILSQIINKAKVTLSGGKSEMVVELKPDSLGKISLKVIAERGMVMAKFTAESNQVKEILESNMQLLKDSLERQGMNVQGFSVSVGHETAEGTRERGWQQTEGKRNSTPRETPEVSARVSQRPNLVNHYLWSESSIDFTA